MIKLLARTEVLKQVRFANKHFSPSRGLIYKSDEPKHVKDLEIIRYNRQDWVEISRGDNNVHFVTLKDYVNRKCCFLLEIAIKDLQHLTDCGYGFLKGH